jgi:hypothetical protein
MIFTVESCPMPSSEQSFLGKFNEAGTWVGLKTHTSNNLLVSGTWQIFQEEIVFK